MFNKQIFEILEKVASTYPEDSEEYQAIKVAAQGLHFLSVRDTNARFQQFLLECDREPTEYEKQVLTEIETEDSGEPTDEEREFVNRVLRDRGIGE